MRCPKCYTETPNEALQCPGCKLPTPRGQQFVKDKKTQRLNEAKTPKARKQKKHVSKLITIAALFGTIMLCAGGSYLMFVYIPEIQATTNSEEVVQKVMRLPSKQEGLSVGEYLEGQVNKAREEGRLAESEGWVVEQVDDAHFIVHFLYEEKNQPKKSAEWKVDISQNSFTPQNDLAKDISPQ